MTHTEIYYKNPEPCWKYFLIIIMQDTFDIIVIWAGSAGLTVALGLTGVGKKVLMIERWLIGWDCTNYGCVPSKALIHADWDIRESLEHTRSIRDVFRHEESRDEMLARYPGLEIVMWDARFVDSHTIEVAGKSYTASHIVIATGSDPRAMPIEWVPSELILSNRTIFDEKDIEKLVIVWGGFIGIEMALAFARKGTTVTMLIRGDRLGSWGEDDDFTLALRSTLEWAWVDIRYHTGIDRWEGSELILTSTTEGDKKREKISFSHILLALGRVPNMSSLELEKATIISDKWGIITDDYGRTNVKHIYAIGDVVSGNRQFTHLANHEGRWVIQSLILPYWKKKIKPANVPSVLYDREIEFARTGLTRGEAIVEYGEDALVIENLSFTVNDRARTEGATEGYIQIVAKRLTLQIVGAEIVAKDAWEMISTLTLALDQKISLYRFRSMVVPYPTRSDLMKRLADKMVLSTLRGLKIEIRWYIGKRIPLLIWLLIWGSIIGAFLYYKHATGKDNLMLMKDIYHTLRTTAIGPVLYILFYAIRPVVFFPATLLTFLSGAIFGVWGGFIFTMIGENMSASVAYLVGRYFGTNIPELRKSPISLDSEKTFSSILFTRFAFFPFDIVNYLSGFLRLPWLPFALATLIGIIPGALVFIIAWASLRWVETFDLSSIHIDPLTIMYSGLLFVVSIWVARVLNKRSKK